MAARSRSGSSPIGKASKRLIADKAYDSAELRLWLNDRGTKPVIPNRSNRKQPFSFNRRLYKETTPHRERLRPIERLQAYRTRYDRLARNFLASVWHRRRSRMVGLMSLDPNSPS